VGYAIIAKNFVILAKILKTIIHGLSVAAGSRHSHVCAGQAGQAGFD
jgi:hypothetical protein